MISDRIYFALFVTLGVALGIATMLVTVCAIAAAAIWLGMDKDNAVFVGVAIVIFALIFAAALFVYSPQRSDRAVKR